MTNPGIVGPLAPGVPVAPSSTPPTYGYELVYNSASSSFAPRLGAKFDPLFSVYNGEALRRFRAQVAKALTSTSTASIVCLGDSITQGVTSTPQRLYNWPARLRAVLAADGRFGVVGEGFASNTGQIKASYDERWTTGTGWNWGGGGFMNSTGAYNFTPGSGTLSFALPSCDTVTIDHLHNGTSWSAFTANLDGGSNTTITPTTSGGLGLQSTTLPVSTIGTHTLNINPNATTGNVSIYNIRWATSNAPSDVNVLTGGGYSGQVSSALVELSQAGSGTLSMLDLVQPDLSIVCIGRNDATGQTNPAQFYSYVETFIQRARTTNGKDVLLLTPPPCLPGPYPFNSQIRAALYRLADAYDVALIDLEHLLSSSWNTAPLNMSTDSLHPNDAGSYRVGTAVANVLLNA